MLTPTLPTSTPIPATPFVVLAVAGAVTFQTNHTKSGRPRRYMSPRRGMRHSVCQRWLMPDPESPSLGDHHARPGRETGQRRTTMTLHARPRLSILFVAVAALVLSLAGAPAVAKDGSVPARPTGAEHRGDTRVGYADLERSRRRQHHPLQGVAARPRRTRGVLVRHHRGRHRHRCNQVHGRHTVKPEKRYIYRIKAGEPARRQHVVQACWGRHPGGSRAPNLRR